MKGSGWDGIDLGMLVFLISISVVSCDVVDRGIVIMEHEGVTTIQLGDDDG